MKLFQQKQERDVLMDVVGMSAFDQENHIVYHESENAISALLLFRPVASRTEKTLFGIESLLARSYPAGTIISVTNFGSPYLNTAVDAYLKTRRETPPVNETILMAQEGVQRRAEMLIEGARKNLVNSVETKILSTLGYFTIKIPLKTKNPMSNLSEDVQSAYNKEVREFKDLLEGMKSQAETFGMYLQETTEAEVLSTVRRYFDPFGEWHPEIDEYLPMNEQLLPPGASLSWDHPRDEDIHFTGFNFDHENNYVGILTIDRYPQKQDNFAFFRMQEMLGKASGNGVQIGMPYALTTTIHYPDQQTKASALRTGQGITDKQANPTMLKWSPRLQEKWRAYQIMNEALMGNNQIVEVNTSLVLFNRSRRELKAACGRLESYYKSMGMIMRRERYIPAVTFFNCLPLNASAESIKKTYRFKTMGSNHAAHLLPIFDEWQGYGNNLLLTTRLGRLFSYDLYSPNNKNYSWILCAESGAGKSFFLNRLVQDYLSVGVKTYLIDRGRSYVAAGSVCDAQIIDFHADSNVCLNPFTHVQEIDEEMAFILPIFAKMLNPDGAVSADESSYLEEAIKSAYERNANKATVTDVINYLHNQENADCNRIARLLGPFASNGSMGRWFNGANTFKSTAQWTILELQDLSSNPRLMAVVMMALTIAITQEMYMSNDGKKKMLIIEEAGDMMGNETFADFTARLISKVRKEAGGIGVVVQNFGQLFQANNGIYGTAIMASAGTRFIMSQKSEMIDRAIASGYLNTDAYSLRLIREAQTVKGKYSEICIMTDNGTGIARLIESPFNRVLFSTEGDTFANIKKRVQKGESVVQLVEQEAAKLQY